MFLKIIIAAMALFVFQKQVKSQNNKKVVEETFQIAAMEQKAAALKQQAIQTTAPFSKASNNFDIHYLSCHWMVDPALRFIQGNVKTGFIITERANTITLDLADELKVDSILFRNVKLAFYRPFDNTVIINLSGFLEKNTKDEVNIFYKGTPPISTTISSFTTSAHAGVPVMWTLSEPYGGRDWWPCKNGLNDKADSIDIAITTPVAYRSSSNGMLVDEQISNGKRTTYWKHRYPIATYLVAFAATNYVAINDNVQLGSKILPLVDYAYPEKVNDFVNAAPITKRVMSMMHNIFTPYPFINEKYGHTQFGFGGGMEHQTNSFMNNMSEGLIVHELAHQWFGDKITCGSWRDIWLNEGFAVYCSNLNIEKNYPESSLLSTYRFQLNNITSKPSGSVYVDDTTSVGRVFDSRLSYNKGGWVLQMLRWKLGDSVFYRAVRNYLNDPKFNYKYAYTTDLKIHFENESKRDLSEFFRDWVYGQGFPSYKLKWAPAGNNWVNITLSQTTSDTSVKFFEMPVPIRFKNSVKDTTIVLENNKNDQVSFIKLGFIPDSAFIDPKLKLISANNSVIKADIFPNAEKVMVFPNPVGSEFKVVLKDMTEGIVHVSLYNLTGQLIWRKRIGGFNGNDLIIIPSAHLSSGNYWLRVNKDEDPVIIKRIVK
jgi:aminopeptidase N